MREIVKGLGEPTSASNPNKLKDTDIDSSIPSSCPENASREPVNETGGNQRLIHRDTAARPQNTDRVNPLITTNLQHLLKPMSMSELRTLNRQRKQIAPKDYPSRATKLVEGICKAFIKTCSPTIVHNARSSKNPDMALQILQAPFITEFMKHDWTRVTGRDGWVGTTEDLALISLELLIAGITTFDHGNTTHYHCLRIFNNSLRAVSWAADTRASQTIEKHAETSVKEMQSDLEESFYRNAPATFKKHHDAALSPHEKARAFVNMVRHYKEYGLFHVQSEKTEAYQLTGGAVYAEFNPFVLCSNMEHLAQELFTNSPQLTVGNVEATLKACVFVERFDRMLPKNGKYDDLWHARRGVEIRFLLKNYQKIRAQLDRHEVDEWIASLNRIRGA